jgi:hypothetical protein
MNSSSSTKFVNVCDYKRISAPEVLAEKTPFGNKQRVALQEVTLNLATSANSGDLNFHSDSYELPLSLFTQRAVICVLGLFAF